MESYKHFSHQHNLNFYQVQQGTKYLCSGCKSPVSGSVFVCWECGFHLHEECFRAKRSINHASHPSHPLTLMPCPTYQSGSFCCNFCSSVGTGFSYSCCDCEFDLHVHCASLEATLELQPHDDPVPKVTNLPSFSAYMGAATAETPAELACQARNYISEVAIKGEEYPLKIHHKSHLEHPLMLHNFPPYDGGEFRCNACGRVGKAKTYHCSTCNFDLHVDCTTEWEETLRRSDHKHPLKLSYSPPPGGQNVSFICDVCCAAIPNFGWWYECSECDYGTHLSCAKAQVRPEIQAVNKAHEDQKEQRQYEMIKQIYETQRRIIEASSYVAPNVVYR